MFFNFYVKQLFSADNTMVIIDDGNMKTSPQRLGYFNTIRPHPEKAAVYLTLMQAPHFGHFRNFPLLPKRPKL